MTETQVIEILTKVSKKFGRYAFAYYSSEDIEQEAFIFGLEALERYRGTGPLEHFLSVHIRNRILNLKRKLEKRADNKSVKLDQAKQCILHPIDLDEVNQNHEPNMHSSEEICKKLSMAEIQRIVDSELEVEYRMDFLKLCEGKNIGRFQREKIVGRVREILSNYGL